MDGAPRLTMTNLRALSRYRSQREQQACRIMQADAAARDRARDARDAAAAALASAERARLVGEQRYYGELAHGARLTIDMLYRAHEELARLTETVQGAERLAKTAGTTLAHREEELLRSSATYRARHREVRKSHLLLAKLEDAIRSRMELVDELETEDQSGIRHTNKTTAQGDWL
ncbi:hypothetical protein [Bradyrhizobium sp. LHD-71]|uniref:hypothetical protein n=1 Tax=Bradyrhizobium sp. LHD-71 TaxID=3072141 RepID=UPI00280ED260|nr:hypothetical protein [Bradyrhizobium sp. LHD-71]MDQ8726882.1 hypothetical protein [Bradyrhizobium sp. LHD-71]